MILLDYLKKNISINDTLEDIVNVFKEMCKSPIEEDLLLFEYGVYGFSGEDIFYWDLVRQYPDEEDEYYQLRVSLMFKSDNENKQLQGTFWSMDTDKDFFEYIRKTSGYQYAKKHKFYDIDIRIDQT